jgi:hypothetical protein
MKNSTISRLSFLFLTFVFSSVNNPLSAGIFRKSATTSETSLSSKIGDERYKGKKKRNQASPAAKSSFSRQSKAARRSVKRNNRYNKKYLSKRSKKQKRQKRFSAKNTFR